MPKLRFQLAAPRLPVQVVNFAYLRSPQEAFPWATLQMGRMHHTLELWPVGGVGGRADGRADGRMGKWGVMAPLQHDSRAGWVGLDFLLAGWNASASAGHLTGCQT